MTAGGLDLLLAERDRAHRIGAPPMESVSELVDWITDRRIVLVSASASVPSATAAIAGRSIRGSWWGDPEGGRIYDLLEQLDEVAGMTQCSLVGGKQTVVAAGTGGVLERVAADTGRRERAAEQLRPADRALARRLDEGPVTNPDRSNRTALEAALLATSRSVHTADGRHEAICQRFPPANSTSVADGAAYDDTLAQLLAACLHSAVAAPASEVHRWLKVVEPEHDRIAAAIAILGPRSVDGPGPRGRPAPWLTLQ